MTGLANLIRRDRRLFFKDKGMLISSLITPVVLLVLYATFLAGIYRDSFAYKCTAQSDPEIIDLLEKGRGTTDDSERAQIYSDVQDWFYDHHSMVPVGQWSTAYAYNSRIGTCDIPITGSPSLRNISVIG